MYRESILPQDRIHEFVAHSTEVNCLCLGPKSNQILATGGEDAKVNIWKIGDATNGVVNIWTLGQNKSPIECLCFDPEEQCIVSGAMSGSIKVFDLNEGRLARDIRGHTVNTTTVQYHPYGEFIVSGSADCTLKVWDVRQRQCMQTYNGHKKEITCVRFSPDGRWVASSSKDGFIYMWDLVAGKLLNSIQTNHSYVSQFEFHPEEQLLAAMMSSKNVKLWDLDTMEPVASTPPETSPLRSIYYGHQGSTLCTATKDSVKIWSLEYNMKMHAAIDTNWDKLYDMKVTDNNELIATSFSSNFVSVWKVDLNTVLERAQSAQPIPTPINYIAGAKEVSNSHQNNRVKSTINSLGSKESEIKDQSQDLLPQEKPNRSNNISTCNSVDSNTHVDNNILNKRGVRDKAESKEILVSPIKEDKLVNNIESKLSSPLVSWESADAQKDMATSMGESFHKREKDRINGNNSSEINNSSSISMNLFKNKLPNSSYSPITQPLNVVSPRATINDSNIASPNISNKQIGKSNITPDKNIKSSSPYQNRQNLYSSPISDNITYESIHQENSNKNDNISIEIIGTKHKKDYNTNNNDLNNKNDIRSVNNNEIRNNNSGGVHADLNKNLENEINKLASQSFEFASTLSNRLTTLKMLRLLWEKGDLSATVDHLCNLQEGSIHNSLHLILLADFLIAIELRGNGLNLDACVRLMPMLEAMLATNEGWLNVHVVKAILKSFKSLCEAFGDLIKQTRAVIGLGGVDLTREERLNRCNSCHDVMSRINLRLDSLLRQHRNNSIIIDSIDKLQRCFDNYL
jgi:katanin p80 WD40 repeat-containing subunit B1